MCLLAYLPSLELYGVNIAGYPVEDGIDHAGITVDGQPLIQKTLHHRR
jgi:hypothetical protein